MLNSLKENKNNIHLSKICGAKVVLFPIKEVLTTKILINIKAGSWYEKGEVWGAFHLLEHLCMLKTKKFSQRESLEKFCEENGISRSASCGEKK